MNIFSIKIQISKEENIRKIIFYRVDIKFRNNQILFLFLYMYITFILGRYLHRIILNRKQKYWKRLYVLHVFVFYFIDQALL